MPKIVTAAEAVKAIPDGATVAVNSSSGLNCPDAVLKALGERFDRDASPRGLTMIHPIAAGDMFGIRGVEHIAKPGLMGRIIGGSYPSGPSSSEPPMIWQMLGANMMPAAVYIYDNKVWGFEQEETTFAGCFGKHFDFDEMMSEQFNWANIKKGA
jgi:acyl CoA:acetate/3-ketoacid CoA transferase